MDKGPYHVVRVLLLQTIITGKVWVWFFFFVDYFFWGGGLFYTAFACGFQILLCVF